MNSSFFRVTCRRGAAQLLASRISLTKRTVVTVGSTHDASVLPSKAATAVAATAALLLIGGGLAVTQCEDPFTPASVAQETMPDYSGEESDDENLPLMTSEEVAKFNGEDGRPIYMSYGGIVYDVTEFIANHPGGSEKIMLAAGTSIEPFWHVYRQHFASELPMKLMEHMVVAKLDEDDQAEIDDQMAVLEETDPYAKEPFRHHDLIIHSDTPMNAETPAHLLTRSYLTPNSLFYIRHHHPVPFFTDQQIQDYKLRIDLSAYHKGVLDVSLADLKKMPKTTITATLQCSGNRRSGFNEFQRTTGTPWGQGAISTATFTGVRLKDLLEQAGLGDPIQAEEDGMEHVRFHSIDGMSASIGVEKAVNPYGDCIIAYEMNGEPLPRDHGYPLRAIVPGYAAVRNVKWLERIELSPEEAEGPWQRGLNYKILPPNVTDARQVKIEKMPSVTEVSLFSGITDVQILHGSVDGKEGVQVGDLVTIQASGWAWAGGGRNVVRVDVTGDDGKSWTTAELTLGTEQKFGRAWAWVFWECDVPCRVFKEANGKMAVRMRSKAVDMAHNAQPESSTSIWNVRGLANNSWYDKEVYIPERRRQSF